MRRNWRLTRLLLFALALAWPRLLCAQDGRNVLVVVNRASPDSENVADAYVKARRIPVDHVVPLQTATTEEIDRRRFDSEIERPIGEWISRHFLQDRILYIVLTKGIPLRVSGTSGLDGSMASVDSELTLLYRKLIGISTPPGGRVVNPYFHGDGPIANAEPLSHRRHDIYLVTRLDGFSANDAIQLIGRAATPAATGTIVFDRKGDSGDRPPDTWLEVAAEKLSELTPPGVRVELGTTIPATKDPILGYYSAGSDDPLIKTRRPGYKWAAGAIAAMHLSTDARTFKEPPESWNVGAWSDPRTYFERSPQSLIGDLVREGATGIAGQVAEPYRDSALRPEILFPAYVAGFNLAESYYLAMPHLSWQTIIVGDPLCAPFGRQRTTFDDASLLDSDTELPRFFSARRLAVLSEFNVRPEIAKLMLKANARLARADPAGARSALETATQLDPSSNASHFLLAGLYERSGEFDLAIARYRTIIKTAPGDVRALNNLAYLLAVEKKSPAEALPLAEKAYRLASARELRADLASALVPRRGTSPDALPFSEDAFDAAASRAGIADTLGWIHHLIGNTVKAEEYLTEASIGAATSGDVHLHVAAFAASQGRTDQARAALEKALALDPALEKSRDATDVRRLLDGPDK